jgi:hypothetical protein
MEYSWRDVVPATKALALYPSRTLTRRTLAVALFTETQSVRDAVADLRKAAF